MPLKGKRQATRVGALVLAAIAVLAVGVFLIGKQNNLFSRKNRYSIDFQNASGLKQGNPVQLNGVDVGSVDEVILPRDPKRAFIRVWITVDRRYADRVRTDSFARIKTLGLLGDKFIELTSGSPNQPVVPSEGAIKAAPATNVDAILASGEDVMDNVVTISHQLNRILGRMDRGEGLLGQLTSDTPESLQMRRSLVETFAAVERIAATVEHGDGALPRLLNDRELADRLARSLADLEGLVASARSGPGLLPGLLNDPAAKQSFDDTLATLNQVAKDLQGFTADLDDSDALLPRLVKDEEYGRQVTDEIRQIVQRLNTVSQKLSEGQGTAAKLINDPQIYEAVNDILIGVNESWMLRWLIRNRQKAGIKKRYEDTGGPQRQGAAETPAPDAGSPAESTEPETGTPPAPSTPEPPPTGPPAATSEPQPPTGNDMSQPSTTTPSGEPPSPPPFSSSPAGPGL